jgi:hypothetical protein
VGAAGFWIIKNPASPTRSAQRSTSTEPGRPHTF